MKKFAILSIASLMTISVAHAEQPTQYFAIGYKMMTLDGGGTDLDLTGTQLTYGKRINEQFVLEGNLVTFVDMSGGGSNVEVTSLDASALYYPLNNQFHVRLGMSNGEVELDGISVIFFVQLLLTIVLVELYTNAKALCYLSFRRCNVPSCCICFLRPSTECRRP